MDLELDTFQVENDLNIGTLQIEQIENGTKVIVELFPENQSTESFESAEFSKVYDILELALCCFRTDCTINHPVPVGTTEADKQEISKAVCEGVSSMLETIRNLQDFKEEKVTSYQGEISIYPILEKLRKEFLITEISSFIEYRTTESVELLEDTSVEVLEEMYRAIDTINERDEERTKKLLAVKNRSWNMKYIFESDNIACREYGQTAGDILRKMYAIEDNLEFLIDTLVEQYPQGKVDKYYMYSQILCDLDSANDEFYIGRIGSNAQEDIYLEVVTKEVAEGNDRDFLSDKSVEELKDYYVGDGDYSYYTKLADTEYYFRFM